jgi:hypothetical protein
MVESTDADAAAETADRLVELVERGVTGRPHGSGALRRAPNL